MRCFIDLAQTHSQRTFGDITALFTWVGAEKKPALVLAPTMRLGNDKEYVPPVIPMENSWIWDEERGDGASCACNCALFAQALGLPEDIRSAMKVMSVIRECIGDLIKMPPKPTERVVVADAIRTDESGKEHHSEIAENV